MPATIFAGTRVKALKSTLNLNGGADIISSSVDPTSSATEGEPGSLLLNTTSGKLYRKNDSGSSTNWSEVGSGGSGINYVTNPSAATNTTGWSTYLESGAVTFQDAGDTVTLNNHGFPNGTIVSFTSITSTTGISTNTPYYVISATTNTFQLSLTLGGPAIALTTNGSGVLNLSAPRVGTGGSPTVTWTRSTTTPLRGSADFNFTKTAVDSQGQGVSTDITIDLADQAKVLTVSFDYEVLSGTYATGDLTIYLIADPSGTPVVIQPAGYQIQSGTAGTKLKQIATFQTQATGQSYRVCFHVASTSASAYSLAIDNVVVGPQTVQYGAPVTDWVDYTPTGTWNTNVTYNGKWRRVGDSMEIRARVLCSGAPNAVGLGINLPSGYSIDTNKLASTLAGGTPLGYGQAVDVGNASYPVSLLYYGSATQLGVYDGFASGTYLVNTNVSNTAPITFGATDFVEIISVVPILGWSSTVQMSNDTDTRVVAAKYSGGSSAYGAGAVLQYNTKDFDTHNAVTTGASWAFLAPVSGYYSILFSGTRSTSGTQSHLLYKNGTTLVQFVLTNVVGTTSYNSGGTTVYLNAGETITIKTDNAATIEVGYISIERISGPSAIAATETVAARYYTGAGQSIPNTTVDTVVNFETKDFDTHGAVTTGAGWRFTAPIAGKYQVSVVIDYAVQAWAANNACYSAVRKNGTTVGLIADPAIWAAGTEAVSHSGSIIVNANAGDYLDFVTANNRSAGAATLFANPTVCHIQIVRVGN